MTMLTGTRWHLSSQLADLEDHGIYIMREVAATFERPALLFSAARTRACCCAWPRRRSAPASSRSH